MKKVLEWLKNPIVWVVAALVVVVVLVVRFFFSGKRTYGKPYTVVNKDLKRESRYYDAVANELESHMQGGGTNEEYILPILRELNDQELREVHNRFGNRTYMDVYLGSVFGLKIGTPGESMDLLGWLRSDFDGSSKDWKYIQERFSSAGIF